jgi:hypothetical protein
MKLHDIEIKIDTTIKNLKNEQNLGTALKPILKNSILQLLRFQFRRKKI